jgi:hypothetical protein
MADSNPSSAEIAKNELAGVNIEGSDGESTASTMTPVGSVDSTSSSTSLTQGLPTMNTDDHVAVDTRVEPQASSSNASDERPVDGVVTRPMLEGYLEKLLKNIPLTTEETKYLCDRVRRRPKGQKV